MSRLRLTVLCLLAGLVGCMEGQKQDPLVRSSLADRLGGRDKVEMIVADFIANVKDNQGLEQELKRLIDEQSTEGLKKHFVELIAGPSSPGDRTARAGLRPGPRALAGRALDQNKPRKKHIADKELQKEGLQKKVPDLVPRARHKAVE